MTTTKSAELDPAPTLRQLSDRVRHSRNHLNRALDELPHHRAGVEAAKGRALVLARQAELELAIAELQAHPDWRG